MADEHSHGSLVKNPRKRDTKQPDYTGQAQCPHCRREFIVVAWVRLPRSGKEKYLALSLRIDHGRN